MEIKVPVEQLEHGMFVQQLDRPWLDTPFLLQGFVIETDEELAALRQHCRYVIADLGRSVGKGHDALRALAGNVTAVARAVDRTNMQRAQPGAAVTVTMTTVRAERSASSSDFRAPAPERAAAGIAAPRAPATDQSASARAETRAPSRNINGPASRPAVAGPVSPEQFAELITPPEIPTIGEELRAFGAGLLSSVADRFRNFMTRTPRTDLGEEPDAPARHEAAPSIFESRPMVTIVKDSVVVAPELRRAHEVRRNSHEAVAAFIRDLSGARKPDLAHVDQAVNDLVEAAMESPDALMWLTQLKSKDAYAYERSIDVSIHMLVFGRHLGYPRNTLHTLGLAGLMLDVGKLRLPQGLLEKKGRLTDVEFALMRRHVQYSLEYLADVAGISPEVLDIVAKHHERHDGSGYPLGLAGDQIGPLAGIAAIVDCFDALTTKRSYAETMSTHQALSSLYNWRGQLFQEGLVEQFIRCIGAFPVGTLVEMNTGEVGVVIAQNKVLKLKPKVMLLLDRSQESYPTPVILDLMTDPKVAGDVLYKIVRDVPVGQYDIDPREFYM